MNNGSIKDVVKDIIRRGTADLTPTKYGKQLQVLKHGLYEIIALIGELRTMGYKEDIATILTHITEAVNEL